MLRDLARAAALRAARALLLPELREALGEPGRDWPELLDVCSYAGGAERRLVALSRELDGHRDARDRLQVERDGLLAELTQHRQALEEVRGRLAAEQRGAALLVAQRDAQQAIAEASVLVAQKMERRAREAEERLRAAQLAAEGGR